ncbi:major facilitator superfamily domain-containing protein [Mycena maculata]|uniref:Major facilitator superfamily domain-containing protein n=1 Tax=Mycena maculata TaxID=230809 RepID=A0AAD7IPC1_9AGAR|nr:major facilitator superfamily domain-containing protein [Mycena maculata]
MSSEVSESTPEQGIDVEKAPSLPGGEFVLPEGGREAWLTMAGAWMVQFCTFGYINAFGVYQDYYTREFLVNKTAADVSWIGSFQLAVQYAMGVLVGRAVDAGYFHHMMVVGSTLYVLCIFLLSLAHAGQFYQVFLAQAVGMGIFPSLIFLPSFTIVSHHFKRRRALAMGIVTSGAACGGVVFPILLNQLGQRANFTIAIRASGGLIGALLLFANLAMRTRLPSKVPGMKSTEQRHTDQPLDWKSMFTDIGYLSALTGAFFTSLGLFFPFFYLQLYAVTNGVDKQLAFYLLTLLNGGSIIGRLVNNSISPRVGSFNLVVSSLYACAMLIFVMLKIKTFAGLAVFAVLYGFASGAYASLMPTNFVGFSNHPGEFGVRLGIAFTVVAPAMLVGNPISGALLGPTTTHFTWTPTIIYNAVMVAVGATFVLIARILYIKRKGKGQWV